MIEDIYKRYSGRGVRDLGIGIKESKETLDAFAKSKGLTYPILMYDKGAVSSSYGVRYIPNMFMFDKMGTLKFRANYMKADDMEKKVQELIK